MSRKLSKVGKLKAEIKHLNAVIAGHAAEISATQAFRDTLRAQRDELASSQRTLINQVSDAKSEAAKLAGDLTESRRARFMHEGANAQLTSEVNSLREMIRNVISGALRVEKTTVER